MITKFWFVECKLGEVAVELNGVTRGRTFFDRSRHGASHELWAGPLYLIVTPAERGGASFNFCHAMSTACALVAALISPLTGM